MTLFQLLDDVLQRLSEGFRQLVDEEAAEQANDSWREPTVDSDVRRNKRNERRESAADHAHNACPAISQTTGLSWVQFSDVDVKNRPKTAKDETVDHESCSLEPSQHAYRAISAIIVLKQQQNAKNEAHTRCNPQTKIRSLLSGHFVDDELSSYVTHHLTDSKNNLIDGLIEPHISQVERCRIVQDLNPEEDNACCYRNPTHTLVLEQILHSDLTAFFLLDISRHYHVEFMLRDLVSTVDDCDFIENLQGQMRALLDQKHRRFFEEKFQRNIGHGEQYKQYQHDSPPTHIRQEDKSYCRLPNRQAQLHSYSESLAGFAQGLLVYERKSQSNGRVRAESYEEQPEADDSRRVCDHRYHNRSDTDDPSQPQCWFSSRVVSDIGYYKEPYQCSKEKHGLQHWNLLLKVLTDHVVVELKGYRHRMRCDLFLALIWLKPADVGPAIRILRVHRVDACERIIKEEGHPKQQPGCQEPQQHKDQEGDELILALTTHTVEQLLNS